MVLPDKLRILNIILHFLMYKGYGILMVSHSKISQLAFDLLHFHLKHVLRDSCYSASNVGKLV